MSTSGIVKPPPSSPPTPLAPLDTATMDEDTPKDAPQRTQRPPTPFLLSLLPLILSPTPVPLPPVLLSDAARQAAHYLALTPEDDAYWTAGTRDVEVVRKRREMIEGALYAPLPTSLQLT